ncbi:MAG: hypothetical protein AB7N65_05005 [Vicinamibacterales bacterium]
MMQEPVELYQVWILSVLLSCAASWIIARRYRRRLQQLMRAPQERGPSPSAAAEEHADRPHITPPTGSLAENRAAGLRLTLLLVASSCLVAMTSAGIYAVLMFPADPLLPWRVIPLGLLQGWPAVLAVALLWRWSRVRVLAALLLWCGATWLVLLGIATWRQNDLGPRLLLEIMASELSVTLPLLALVFLGQTTRAIAPWLLVPFALLAWSSLAGIHAMVSIGQQRSPAFSSIIVALDPVLGWLPWYGVMLMFILLPWVAAWRPARALGRALGRAYSRKWFSDLLVIYTAVWAFSLTDKALTVATQTSTGLASLSMYVPLVWIPIVFRSCARRRTGGERGPTLLVLRVFHQERQTQSLFDQVVERWRLSGNTVLIAGTDLADRTIDADDIFRFLDRRLAERFIASPADVAARVRAFDLATDIDGRYRVNECYCHDTTWQDALQVLVLRSDVVLMDLRGFQAHNAGCRYELATLTNTPRPLRVVVLTDARTDHEAANEAVASGRPERFTWVDASCPPASPPRKVLAHLFG